MARHLHPTAAAVVTLALLATGCTSGPTLSPSPSPTRATTSPTLTSTPTASPTPRDLTRPGEARRMLEQLLAAAGPGRLIMAEATADTASVSVLPSGSAEPVTWAYRDGKAQPIESDLQYVDQASFDLDDFDISDLGRLFRVAAGVSESTHRQTLQIVDYSGGRVVMAVTTNPESRTVFFLPDGSLLPVLNYHGLSGITQGLAAVAADRPTAEAVGIDSESGAWMEFSDSGTTTRRQRPAKVPVTTLKRDERTALPTFTLSRVRPDAIWRVLERTLSAEGANSETEWSVTIDDRAERGTPRMYFTIGPKTLVTDLAGVEIAPS